MSDVFTIPNIISFVRLLLVPLFLWLLFAEDNVAGAGWHLAFIGATDWVDGYLARRLNQVSKIGEFLDPLADRLAVAAAVIGGLIADVLPAWFAWAIIIRELLIAVGALVIGVRAGTKLTVRPMGKLATLMLYAAIAWFYIGIGWDWDWLVALAWIVGVPGLILYWIVGFQYFNDARRIVAEGDATTA